MSTLIPKFPNRLISWYEDHKRDLPWRSTHEPYQVWLSEIILQQTRVDQGMAYYLKFIDHYPTVQDLANAKEEEVLKDWQGLGYYSRARNLHFTAKYVTNELNGQFPNNFKDLQQLKGVGKYTAAAIASFCFGEVVPVVDGNVYRVICRLMGIDTPIDTTAGAKAVSEIAEELISKENPATYNQAIMEFGALQCTPKKPDCMFCPFNEECVARGTNRIHELPIKAKKIKQRERHFHYLVIRDGENIYLNKRTEKGIWQHLYDFPLIEADQALTPTALLEHEELKALLGQSKNYKHLQRTNTFKHILSHQIIKATFWEFEVEEATPALQDYTTVNLHDLDTFAVPKLIENYLKSKPEFH